ncbi:MAG: alpha/beta fold hydrolase, partial [Phycisphaerales bacterium]|nr:alpha/beta fold hydrolase [Phycisphaerales bacterium]
MRRRLWRWSAVYGAALLASCVMQFFWPGAERASANLKFAVVRPGFSDESSSRAAISLAYRELGQGTAIVLLHGSPGGRDDFSHLAPLLAESYRVIVPDLAGWGASQQWGIGDYGVAAQARYVLALLDELEIDSAHVVGFSWGGGVAIELATRAPPRVRSLSLYAAIGIQEGEGSGDYYFEHFKYACGYALCVVAPEFVPHFGLLGPRSLRHTFIRSFWDTDQRPLRSMLERLHAPALILHGLDDPLVPADTAREHHRLVASSELVMLDASHFLLFSAAGSKRIADELMPFLARVEAGERPARRTRDLPDRSKPALLPGNFQLERSIGPWVSMLAIMIATFVSEDMTCIVCGLLIHRAHLDFFVGLLGCFWGILLGDVGLWLIGRVGGRRVLRSRLVASRLSEERLEALRGWFDLHGWKAVLAARFLPGTRFPVYVGAGIAGHHSGRFLMWAALAALLWTPLLVGLVSLFGNRVLDPLQRFFGNGWIALFFALVGVYVLVHTLLLACTRLGRARLIARISRLWRWEFWPAWIFYLPLIPYVLYLMLRHRGVTVPTAANPAIPHGGVVGESKYEILRRLPVEDTVPTALIASGDIAARVDALSRRMRALSLGWPVILKPDVGQRGVGLKLAHNLDEAREHLASHPDAMVLQGYHAGPHE